MNSDTGEIKPLGLLKKKGLIDTLTGVPKPPWVPCGDPDPKCKRCGGKGSVLVDLTKDLNYGNRAERRRLPRGQQAKYVPCPDCAEANNG